MYGFNLGGCLKSSLLRVFCFPFLYELYSFSPVCLKLKKNGKWDETWKLLSLTICRNSKSFTDFTESMTFSKEFFFTNIHTFTNLMIHFSEIHFFISNSFLNNYPSDGNLLSNFQAQPSFTRQQRKLQIMQKRSFSFAINAN